MNYKSHRIGGLCAGLIVASSIVKQPYTPDNIASIICLTAAAEFGSYLPDLDEPNSYIGKKAKPISNTLNYVAGHRGFFHSPFALAIIDVLLFLLYEYVNNAVSTNEIIKNSLIFLIGLILLSQMFMLIKRKKFKLTVLLWCIGSIYFLSTSMPIKSYLLFTLYGLTAGFLSHLLMDSLTVSGIPWLFPFNDKKIRFAKLRTNKNEWLARFIFILPTIIILLFRAKCFI